MAVPVIFFHLLLAFGTAGCAVATPFVEGVAAVLPAADTVVWSATGTESESGSLTIFAVPLRVDSVLVNRMLRLRNDPEFLFPVPRLKSLLP
jgi:hypothetical protein